MIANTTPAAAARTSPANEPKHEPVDLYADLFAALFTVPTPPSVPAVVHSSAETGVETALVETEPSFEKGASPGFFLDELSASFAAKTPGDEGGSTIGQRTLTGSPRDTQLVMEIDADSPELLGPPVEGGAKKGRLDNLGVLDERPPMPPSLPCEMPAVREKMRAEGISAELDPETDIPVDVLTLEDDGTGPLAGSQTPKTSGIDLLEVPAASSGGAEQPIEVIEVAGTFVSERFIDNDFFRNALDPIAPVRSTRSAVEITHDASRWEGNVAMPSLLDTFAANVASEPKTVLTPKSLGPEVEADPAEAWLPDSSKQLRVEESDAAADFGFDTSVGSRSEVPKPAPFQLSDVKVRRILFDQVGSQVMDFALRNPEISDKQSIKIKLRPEELGTVEITLVKSGEGTVEAHFHTDNPQTQHLLNETLVQLRESLENSGIKVGALETSCSSAFGNGDEAATDRESQQATERSRLRTTFDDPPVTDRSVTDRLLNLRA